jgi:glycosidase
MAVVVLQGVTRRPGAALVLAALLLSACGGSGVPAPPPLPSNTSGWWRDQVGYEIFVRSFADSDGDGVGDLKGLTARLSELNDGSPAATTNSLGVDFVWLMPIFPSPSYHGYDVTDYRSINPQYGTLDDFDAFVTAAHARHIRVVLDMVLNHSSAQHPWFLDSASGAASAKRDWYTWSLTDPGWSSPVGNGNSFRPWGPTGNYYFAVFGGSMPDLNLRSAAVEAELVASMKFWLARGVDGFRLDAVRYFVENGAAGQEDQPETHAFLQRVRAALQAQYPDTLLVAEAWAAPEVTASYYGQGNEAQLAFSFSLNDAMLTAAQTGTATALGTVVDRFAAALDATDRGFEAPFLSNHDTGRGVGALGWSGPQARMAAATLLAMPGTPFLYYGDEIGMQGQPSWGDPGKRTPYRWTTSATGYHGFTTGTTTWFDASYAPPTEPAGVELETQRTDPASLYNHFRTLIRLRHAQPPLARGGATRLTPTGGGTGAFALLRTWQGKRVLFVANYAATASGAISVGVGGTPAVLLDGGLNGAPSGTSTSVTIPGLGASSFAFLSLD